jgi:hypothetical protein
MPSGISAVIPHQEQGTQAAEVQVLEVRVYYTLFVSKC